MESLHGLGAMVGVIGAAALVLASIVAFVVDRGHAAVRLAWIAYVALMVAQALAGLVLLLGGGPRESLHLLYGAVLIAVVPFALRFAEEAPDRDRTAVLAVAGLAALLICWRLFATG